MSELKFDADRWYLPDDDLLGFLHVPAGKFLMGSDDLTEDEKPKHALYLPEFWMARTPVTVAQFRFYCQQSDAEPFDPAALATPDHHPVVQVSWHAALAYCSWLESKLREYVRGSRREGAFWDRLFDGTLHVLLPSEAEWEKTARGTDGRRYPWGHEFDACRLNIDETGLGATSAVGSFPLGASPYGALDMAGNVWEWTRSVIGEWDRHKDAFVSKYEYPYDPHDGREDLTKPVDFLRGIRGGSYAHDRSDTPCAYRGYEQIDFRGEALGFRVVLSA